MDTPSPIRLLAAFLNAKTRALAKLRDEGGLFENRFLQRLVVREQQAVSAAATEAGVIVQDEIGIEQLVAEITSPDSEGGTAITPHESRRLKLALRRLDRDARTHSATLTHLAQA